MTGATTPDAYAFVGTVHGLLQSADSSSRADIILAAVLQSLHEADRSTHDIFERVQRIWPGSLTGIDDVRPAINVGRELRLIAEVDSLGDHSVWTLSKTGVEDVQRHARWVADLRTRAAEEVRHRAISGLQLTVTSQQAHQWLDRVIDALQTAIRTSHDSYMGRVDGLIFGDRPHMAPRAIDRAVLFAAFEGNDAVTQFLRALTIDAIDPLDSFGNELVSHITTGCVLHAYVAGLDRTRLLQRIGNPAAQRAVLDTPYLIDLLGPTRLANGLQDTIRAAVETGWQVIALEHSIDEAQAVLHRDVPRIEEEFRTAHDSGVRREWYASLAAEQLPSLCIEVLQDGTYRNLHQLLAAADALPQHLADLGVEVRAHNNGDDARVDRLRTALDAHLEADGKGRSQAVLQRDAHTMAMLWRTRRRSTGKWPGGWVITKDRAMAPVYAEVAKNDRVDLCLSMNQWTTLLAVCTPPTEVGELARAAAGQFVDEAAWTLPMRFPAEVALDLARQLSPDHGGSPTDLRVAQMSLDQALDREATSAGIAGEVLSLRARRVDSLSEAERRRLTEDASQERATAAASREEALVARAEKLETDRALEQVTSEKDSLAMLVSWHSTQLRRICIAGAAGLVMLTLLVSSIFLASSLGIALVAAGSLGYLVVAYRWCTRPEMTLFKFIAGGLISSLGTISSVIEIAGAISN